MVGSRGVFGERLSMMPGILVLLSLSSNDLGGRNGGITGFNVPPSSSVDMPGFNCCTEMILSVQSIIYRYNTML